MGDICKAPMRFDVNDIGGLLILGVVVGVLISAFVYGSKLEPIYGSGRLLLAGFLSGLGWLTGIHMLLEDVDSFMAGMDPNEILSRCKEHLHNDLEEAYSLATKRAYTLFVNFFVYWIILGVANVFLIYTGPLHWFTTLSMAVFSLFGFISLILWIISYLRYRDYSKKLLVIQLKKNEKAEISIKI